VSQAYLAALFPNCRRQVLSFYLAMNCVGGIVFPLWAELLLRINREWTDITFARVLHLPFCAIAVVDDSAAVGRGLRPCRRGGGSLDERLFRKDFSSHRESFRQAAPKGC
jgi:hypothetical protein